MEFIIDPSLFGIDKNNFETTIISHHGTQDYIIFYYCGIVFYYVLLLRHSLFIMIFLEANFAIDFTWLLSWHTWHKRSLVALKLLNWSWIQPRWCARNQATLISLIGTSLILDGRSAYCFLLYAWYYLAITQSFRLFCRRLNANFTEDEM